MEQAMNCETWEEKLWLYLYEEMAPGERAAADAHLSGCAACRTRLEEAEGLRSLLTRREAPEPPPELLADARIALDEALDREDLGWRGWARALTRGVPMIYASRTATVLTILALGFGLGWMVRPGVTGSGSTTAPDGGNPALVGAPEGGEGLADFRIHSISELEPDTLTGQLQITLGTQRQVTLTGSLDDPQIRRVLLHTVRNYNNPGIRRDTLDLLRQRAAIREVRDTFIYVMRNDANDGVRMEALEAVQGLKWSPEVRAAFLHVAQNDTNPGLRIAAVNALAGSADRQVLPVLRELAEKDSNTYIRMQCANAVRELEGEEF